MKCFPSIDKTLGQSHAFSWLVFVLCLLISSTSSYAANKTAKPAASTFSFRGALLKPHGKVNYAENEKRLFVPASVMKLIVCATALHHLGANHRRTTQAWGKGSLYKGTLRGDLVLKGAGDPTWNRRFFPKNTRAPVTDLANQLYQKGLRKIAGNILIDVSAFAGPSQAFNYSMIDRGLWYGAAVSALAVDENNFSLHVAPGKKVGAKGIITKKKKPPFQVENKIITVSKALRGKGSVGFFPSLDRRTLRVAGEYPINEPAYTVRVSVPNPEVSAAQAFTQALRKRGIRWTGTLKIVRSAVAVKGKPWAQISSPPLSEWLPVIMGRSHNWYAEMLLRIVALEVKGSGRLSTGLRIERQFLQKQVGLPSYTFFLEDASGLSPKNLLSPVAVVSLLEYAAKQPWASVFRANLSTPKKGTLSTWPKGLPAIQGKTGTLQHTIALAGYLPGKRVGAFVIFVNHQPGNRYATRKNIVRLLKKWGK